jgi:hypothetical protein
MTTNSRKQRLVRELGLYFAEKGRIVSAREYKYISDRPKFLSMKEIVKVMGSYTTAVNWIEKYEPELWDTIHGVKPKPPSPLEELAKKGKKNGKDI